MSSKQKASSETPMEMQKTKTTILTNATFDCSCGKQYKHRQSLLTHQKKCGNTSSTVSEFDSDSQPLYVDENNVPITIEMIHSLIDENKQLRLILLAYIKTLKDIKSMAEQQQRIRNGGPQVESNSQEEQENGEEEEDNQ